MRKARLIELLSIGLFIAMSGCSHTAPSSRRVEEPAAEKAVEKTEEDERMAPIIQRDVNAIFFLGKEKTPGGLDAFAPDRIQELELDLVRSDRPAVRYYVENREYFDRVEDSGGGFRIAANAKRLNPFRKTKSGRRKLFGMDTARVKTMIANPCFSAVEDCGEDASDGEENTALLDEWVKKYPEKELRSEREKVLRSYLAALEKYRSRIARGVPSKTKGKGKAEPARQGALTVGTHIRGVEMLLKE